MKNVISRCRWRTRLAIQEFGPSMSLLMLPGGLFIFLSGLIHRHWPLGSDAAKSSMRRRTHVHAVRH